MEKQVYNPYLPEWEYVPDGEPHVFGDRVYVYGSHDRFGAPIFCVDDYVCWSAPVDDLSDWKYEGVIYKKKQDPANWSGLRCLYAPDVTVGADGRYYLYYAFDFMGRMGVAVCDSPAGPYEFYGHVKYADGHIWGTRSGEPFPFDPGVFMDTDGSVYLYSGFATKVPFAASRFHNLSNDGGVVLQLEQDMLTIKAEPKLLFPRKGKKGAFENHAFFEASSIRKVGDNYCFVYSSEHNHELCYAMSDSPMGPFTYGGTLVDIGDIFLNDSITEKHAKNYLGNTHGGLLQIEDNWYIFYHRQTNRNSYARQACAEKLERTPDGGFKQAEMTSCGLNGRPLNGLGRYEARIACNLWMQNGTARYDRAFNRIRLKDHPYFTQSRGIQDMRPEQYIANMRDGAVAGFKYFMFKDTDSLTVEVRGKAEGRIEVSTEADFSIINAEIPVHIRSTKKEKFSGSLHDVDGCRAFYFRYTGSGAIDFFAFELQKSGVKK